MHASYPAPGQARVGSALREGWATLRAHFWTLLGISLLGMLLGGLVNAPFNTAAPLLGEAAWVLAVSGIGQFVVAILVMAPIQVGIAYAYLRASRGERPLVGSMFDGFKRYRDVVLATLAVTGLVVAGLLLLIVPGIIVGLRLFMVPYLIMDEGLRPKQALRASWDATRGHAWRYFLLCLTAIPIVLAGLLALVVGVFVAMVWISAASAAFYRGIRERPASSPGPQSVAPAPLARPA